jgi:hypothetical protein
VKYIYSESSPSSSPNSPPAAEFFFLLRNSLIASKFSRPLASVLSDSIPVGISPRSPYSRRQGDAKKDVFVYLNLQCGSVKIKRKMAPSKARTHDKKADLPLLAYASISLKAKAIQLRQGSCVLTSRSTCAHGFVRTPGLGTIPPHRAGQT